MLGCSMERCARSGSSTFAGTKLVAHPVRLSPLKNQPLVVRAAGGQEQPPKNSYDSLEEVGKEIPWAGASAPGGPVAATARARRARAS
jgi:hypothetical protein